jgi:predicted amidohydrolase
MDRDGERVKKLKTAAAQFSLRRLGSEQEFWDRAEALVKGAAGANIIVFPEYFSLSLLVRQKQQDFRSALRSARSHSEAVADGLASLAKKHDLLICAGTLPWPESGRLLNRSFLLFPDGKRLHQDKINMTRFEREEWLVDAGDPAVTTFDFRGVNCAVLTCYDSEFADLSRVLGQAKVELLFVPSCTDTEHGYWRVRHCCEARAVENQMFVLMSSIVGGDSRHPEIDAHHGQGAIFSPCDRGFPANGLLGQGEAQQEGLAIAELDFKKLADVRADGAVLNLRDGGSARDIIWHKA